MNKNDFMKDCVAAFRPFCVELNSIEKKNNMNEVVFYISDRLSGKIIKNKHSYLTKQRPKQNKCEFELEYMLNAFRRIGDYIISIDEKGNLKLDSSYVVYFKNGKGKEKINLIKMLALLLKGKKYTMEGLKVYVLKDECISLWIEDDSLFIHSL